MILYTIDCVKCRLLEERLQKYEIPYEICNDTNVMAKLGIMSVPVLEVKGELLNYAQAMKWAKEVEEQK